MDLGIKSNICKCVVFLFLNLICTSYIFREYFFNYVIIFNKFCYWLKQDYNLSSFLIFLYHKNSSDLGFHFDIVFGLYIIAWLTALKILVITFNFLFHSFTIYCYLGTFNIFNPCCSIDILLFLQHLPEYINCPG